MNSKCLLFFSWLLLPALYAQKSNIRWHHFTIDQGLPSNECHDLIIDESGYVWIATDRGIARFDGAEFKIYEAKDGLKDISVLKIRKDKRGRIWASTNKKLFFYKEKYEEVFRPYPFNSLLDSLTPLSNLYSDFNFDRAENLYVSAYDEGCIKISMDGKFTKLNTEKTNTSILTYLQIEDEFLSITKSLAKEHSHRKKNSLSQFNDNVKIIHNNRVIETEFNPNIIDRQNYKAHKLVNDTVLYNIQHIGYLCNKNGLIAKNKMEQLEDIYVDSWGGGYAINLFAKKMIIFKNAFELLFDKGEILDLQEPFTSVNTDSEKNLFLTTLGNGIFIGQQSLDIIPLNSNTIGKNILSLRILPNNHYVYLENYNKVILADFSTSNVRTLYTTKGHINDLQYDEDSQEVIIVENPVSHYYNINSQKTRAQPSGQNKKSNYLKKIILKPKHPSQLKLYGEHFELYDAQSKKTLYESPIGIVNAFQTAISWRNRIILGGQHGLFELKNNNLVSLQHIHPMFQERINTLSIYKGFLLVGTQGKGLVVWNGNENFIIIDEKKGLISDNIEHLYVNSAFELFVSTYKGLSKIIQNEKNGIKITNYTTLLGLPSNEVRQCLSHQGNTYVVTGKGIGMFMNDSNLITPPKKPTIEQIEINGTATPVKNNYSLKPDENNILIRYKSVDISQMNEINYEYRLDGAKWTKTRNTEILYQKLAPKSYEFAVRASNKYGTWSDKTVWNFKIMNPWYNSLPFYFLILIGICMMVYVVYLLQKNKLKIENEMLALQQSALQAQMNPHFIFNCLNSIQNYIMLNQKEDAMTYMSRFAQYVRENLNASTENMISLDKEIEMLENYMNLEQIRFGKKFKYFIHVDKKIEKENIKIPPLLVQPFVENAIIHGLKHAKSEGLLNISFSLDDQILTISILDNGIGYSQKASEQDHKSLGISITQKRLDFINQTKSEKYSILKRELSKGTEVVVKIKIV
jgi:hypothetical protein